MAGYYFQGESWRFLGFIFGVEDGNSYLAKMLSGAVGEILFKTPYTTIEQNGFIAFLPYILLGKLTSNPGQHEQLVALFQIFRWGGILLLSYASYYFISLFIEGVFYRRTALVMTLLGGGFGWVSLFWNKVPLEIYSPETFGFLSVFGIPHLLYSKALLILGLYLFIARSHEIKNACLIGTVLFLVGYFQPLTIVVGWFILAAYFTVWFIYPFINRKANAKALLVKEISYLFVIGLISSPWVIYNMVSFQMDPYLKGWYSQNIILSPEPIDYLISFGLFVPFVIWGALLLHKKSSQKFYFMMGWLFAFPIMVYFPIIVQRRMAEGFWNIVVILSIIPLAAIAPNRKLIIFGAALLLTSSITLYSGGLLAVTTPSQPVYIPKTELEAINYLKTATKPWDTILAPYQISNSLPAWVPVRVLAGHGPESVNFKQVELDIDTFYNSQDPKIQNDFIKQYHLNFVLLDSREEFMQGKLSFKKVYQNQDYAIFQYVGK
jgi:hypothetical protein